MRFPLCSPPALGALFEPFASFDGYRQPFLGGQGPAPAYAMALDEDARARLRERLWHSLPAQADGSIALTARAWAIRATVAA